jgi:hypothetical protein
MGPIRRTINLILALALAAAGIRKPLQERTLIGLPAPVANHSSMMHRNAVLERVRAHADQSSEATRVHHASRRRGGLAARGTRAGGACRLLLGGRAKSTELQVSHARTSLSCWFRTTSSRCRCRHTLRAHALHRAEREHAAICAKFSEAISGRQPTLAHP